MRKSWRGIRPRPMGRSRTSWGNTAARNFTRRPVSKNTCGWRTGKPRRGRVVDFGTTGKVRFSDLVMYDRQTESWWQQVTGEAIVGEMTGKRLVFLPSQIISWETFKLTYPGGKVLNRETGHGRSYGRNPYVGYDNINSSPFLYVGRRTVACRRWSAWSQSR